MEKTQDFSLLNGLALAYVGDAIYEVYIRDYLVKKGNTRPNMLHQKATFFVSAKGQADSIQAMLDEKILNQEEEDIYRRGRNAKSHTTAKNADVKTYRMSTGFEALMGYLHLLGKEERLNELMHWCVEQKEKK